MREVTMAAVAAALTLAGPAANAASVTYDFTGTIYGGQGVYAGTVGDTVTGTITIDLANGTATAQPAPDFNIQDLLGNTGNVFSMTAQVAGLSYASTTPVAGDFAATSNVGGKYNSQLAGSASVGNEWLASESVVHDAAGTNTSNSSLVIVNPSGAYAGNFLPTTTGIAVGTSGSSGSTGFFGMTINGQVSGAFFDLNTLSPTAVPLPPSAWLLGSGLLALAGIRRRPA